MSHQNPRVHYAWASETCQRIAKKMFAGIAWKAPRKTVQGAQLQYACTALARLLVDLRWSREVLCFPGKICQGIVFVVLVLMMCMQHSL